jgi:Alkylmercury lyase
MLPDTKELNMSQRKPIGLMALVALAGISIGATRASAAASSKRSAASTRWIGKQQAAKPPQCPLRPGQDWPEAEDQKEATRYRHAILDGIFKQWVELGRAPTPEEFAQRMKLTQPEADRLLDEMQACGESTEAGILRAPTSELIAIAWPLANIPTGIIVTVDGGKPVFGRCAIDALGVSEMLGKKTTVVEAVARDNGSPLRVVVSGQRIVSAEPAGIVIVKGRGCDKMSFFSSKEAGEKWQKEHDGEGTLFTLANAVKHGADIFGSYSEGLQ